MEYYISNGGNDANSGTSDTQPWETLSRLQTLITSPGLAAGDVVNLHRDSVFHESLSIPTNNDGTSADPILFHQFGASGNNPVISAFKHLTGWTSLGGNVYEIQDIGFPSYINLLMIDGVSRPKRIRDPLITTDSGTTTTLVSSNIPNYDYSGGEVEVVLEKNDWIHDKSYVVSVVGNTLTYNYVNGYPVGSQKRYQIQNCIEELLEDGDWMYSPSQNKLTIYSSTNPDSRNIQVSYRPQVFSTLSNAWNTFSDLELSGANLDIVRNETASGNVFENLVFRNGGAYGISLWTSLNNVIRGCVFDNTYDNAIHQRNASNNLLVENCLISDVATFFGVCGNGDGSSTGILSVGHDTVIRNNRLTNIGYIAVRFFGDGAKVYKNFIENYCITKHDGGGIYCYGGSSGSSTYIDRELYNNILVLADGRLDSVYAIYIDDNSENVDIHNNTLLYSARAAFFNHNSHEINFNNNVVYSAYCAAFYAHGSGNELIRNNEQKNNVIVLTAQGQTPYILNTSNNEDDFEEFGDFNDNTFILCSHKEAVFATRFMVSGKTYFNNRTLSQWRALGHDIDSEFIFLNIPEFTDYTEGSNLFGDGTFETTMSNVGVFYQGGSAEVVRDTTSQITGIGSVRCSVISESSVTTRIELIFSGLGIITSGNAYVLRFKAKAPSGHQSLNIYLRESGTPYTVLSREIHTVVGSSIKEFEFFFYNIRSAQNGTSLVIDLQSYQGTLYVDDFEFRELTSYDKTDYEEHVKVVYNDQDSTENVPVSGGWEYIDGNPVGGSVELGPFESAVILKSDEPDPGPLLYYRGKKWTI